MFDAVSGIHHAYYLNCQNKRGENLRAWWSIVNWEEAARRFERSSVLAAEHDWEDEGETVLSAKNGELILALWSGWPAMFPRDTN